MKQLYRNNRSSRCLSIPWIVALLCLLPGLARGASGSFTHTATFDTSQLQESEYISPNGEAYTSLSWEGLGNAGEIGEPELPVGQYRFLIPTYCNNLTVEVIANTSTGMRLCRHKLLPVQEPITTGNDPIPPFTTPLKAAYAVSTTSPKADVVNEFFLAGDRHIVDVAVSPVSYAGAVDKMEVFESITFKVSWDECGVNDMAFRPIPSRSDVSETLEAAGVLDPMGIQAAAVAKIRAAAVTTPISRGDYFIIVPETLEEAVADLALWKRQKGYNVTVKTIESILADPRYAVNPNDSIGNTRLVDEAASLRGYLYDNCKDPDNTFCLLVGNSKTSMPIRRTYDSGNFSTDYSKNPQGENYVPTDNYFADPITKWELTETNGIYSISTYKPTFSPTIAIGRLLCSKPIEIEHYFKKLLLYETNPGYGDNDYLENAFFFEEDVSTRNMLGNSQIVRDELSFIPNIILVQDDRTKHPSVTGVMGKSIINHMKGKGFSSWHGHGGPGGVETTRNHGSYGIAALDSYVTSEIGIRDEDNNGLDNLNNNNYPQIIYSISCDNAPFDEYIDKNHPLAKLPYNLAESFTIAGDYGGPCFLGNTRVGYVETSEKMEAQFIMAIKTNPIVGKAENISKVQFLALNPTYYTYKHIRTTHSIIGDPELEVWRGKPEVLDLIINTGSSIEITGSHLAGAKVSLSDGLNNIYYASSIPSRFSINHSALPYNFNFNGYAVSVWKTGTLPMVRFIGDSGTLTGLSKSFVVRDALIGSAAPGGSTFTIGTNGNLRIRAIDEIKAGDGFIIGNSGNANLNCERNIKLGSTTVKKGGNLEARGEKVTLEAGFTVEAGGTLYVSGN